MIFEQQTQRMFLPNSLQTKDTERNTPFVFPYPWFGEILENSLLSLLSLLSYETNTTQHTYFINYISLLSLLRNSTDSNRLKQTQ